MDEPGPEIFTSHGPVPHSLSVLIYHPAPIGIFCRLLTGRGDTRMVFAPFKGIRLTFGNMKGSTLSRGAQAPRISACPRYSRFFADLHGDPRSPVHMLLDSLWDGAIGISSSSPHDATSLTCTSQYIYFSSCGHSHY